MANGIIGRLDLMVADRSLLKHPFYQEWNAGTLSRERLRDYAAQYYRHVAAFPRYLSAIHSRSADIRVRQALLDNLIDEERGDDNHPELWMRFAEGLGVSRTEVLESRPRPPTTMLVETFDRIARELPVAAGLGALYVYEAQIPTVATTKIDGLKRFYGITDDRTLAFFTVHQQADVFHAEAVANAITRETNSRAGEEAAALDAGAVALDVLWKMLDAV